MKKSFIIFKKFFFVQIIILLSMLSCQKETTEIINAPEDEIVQANSSIANLISRTVSNDGSVDNIIDYANCLKVVLPVTVVVNNITVIIENYSGYDAVEAVLDASQNSNDTVIITFPVTVILNNYTEVIINTQEELDAKRALCNGENEDDDDIECIDFEYPINFSVYDSNFQFSDTLTIENDEALYGFIANLQSSVLASFNYPVTMVLNDGASVLVNSNQELEAVILGVVDSCDEDDDYDYNDDDVYECNEEAIELTLKECAWYISSNDQPAVFENYFVNFESDYNFVAYYNDYLEYTGEWSVAENLNNNTYEVTFTTNWAELNGTWKVTSCTSGDLALLKTNTNIELTKNCNTIIDNPFACFSLLNLESCDYDGDGMAEFSLYEAFGTPLCTSNISTLIEFYSTLIDAETQTNPASNTISFESQTLYIRVNIVNSPNAYRIFSITLSVQDCTTQCAEQDVNNYLMDCKWNIVTFNGNNNFIQYDFKFDLDGALVITNTTNSVVDNANWLVFTDNTTGRIILGFTNINDTYLSDIYGNSGLVTCNENSLEFEKNGSGLLYLMDKNCN